MVQCIFAPEHGVNLIASSAGGFVIGGGIFMAGYLISNGGLGGGDVKLFAVLGYYLGYRLIVMVFVLTILLAASCSITLIIWKKMTVKDELPLAPFVLAATILTIL